MRLAASLPKAGRGAGLRGQVSRNCWKSGGNPFSIRLDVQIVHSCGADEFLLGAAASVLEKCIFS
jgi:hypothetical protein